MKYSSRSGALAWRRHASVFILAGAALALAGCSPNPKSGRGFRLPDGDAERGRQAFVALNCVSCHQVDGVTLPAPVVAPAAVITLGGEVTEVRTYGRLVTAIIHPATKAVRAPAKGKLPSSQEMARPRMPSVNEVMTVQEMVDLVAFLQPHYRDVPLAVPDLGYPMIMPR